jgi:predicted metallopeptidase
VAKKDPVQVADELERNGGELQETQEEEPQSPKWLKCDELKPIVSELVQMFPDQLNHIRPASIGYAAFSKKKSKYGAKVYPMRPMYGLFSAIEYIIAVHLESWAISTKSKKYLLILHELMHIPAEGFESVSKKYRKTVDHDVKDFAILLREYGIDWENSDKIFEKTKKLVEAAS